MLSFAALGLWLAGTTSMEEPFSFQTGVFCQKLNKKIK